ncbi:MAG: hypothetical protein R3B57_07255 [Phycisphaerales bacterium]
MSQTPRPSPGRRPVSPTEVFLGPEAARGGPFALLGLPPRALDDVVILDARDRRMRQIDQHPLAETPEADEVRLSLYAAAAQLLNPSVRARLAESWGARASASAAGVPVPTPTRPAGLSTSERLLEHDAILALAMFGGWNKRSLRRIASIAHARGLGSREVAQTLRRIGHRRRPRARSMALPAAGAIVRTPPPSFGAKPEPGTPLDEQIDPAQRLLKLAIIVSVVAVVTLVSLVIGVVGLMNLAESGQAPTVATAPEGSNNDAATVSSRPVTSAPRPTSRPRTLPEPDALGDPELIVREFDASTRALELTPFEATRRFSDAVRLFASTWVSFDAQQRGRAMSALERFLESAASAPDASRLAIDAVGAGLAPLSGAGKMAPAPDDVWPAVWSAGALARVRSTPLLNAAERAQADRLLRTGAPDLASGASDFVPGGVAGARLVRDRLVHAPQDEAAWIRWLEAVDALAADDETVRTILITEALDDLLASPVGQVDPRTPAIERATLALSWRRDSGARRWLLRTLDRPGALSGALSRLIAALASRSAAPGIDATVSLSPNADMSERRALRTRLERAWRVDQQAELDSLSGDMRKAMQALFRERTLTSDARGQFLLAVRLALLNSAASLAHDGVFDEAAHSIERSASLESQRSGRQSNAAPLAARSNSDGSWAIRYDEAGSDADKRIALLDALSNREDDDIGPVDAAMLVDAAIRSAPRTVQDRARETLRSFLRAPAVLSSLLERLAEMPRSDDMVEIIELATTTPISHDRRDGVWRTEARQALVSTLIDTLASGSAWGSMDDQLIDLADAYQLLVSPVAASSGPATAPTPQDSARLLRLRWRREAERAGPAGLAGLTPDIIERRRTARLELATSPIQEFLAEQLAACETLALLTSSERAGVGADVSGVLKALDDAQGRSGHIAEQIAACEEAMARLWLIREGVGP